MLAKKLLLLTAVLFVPSSLVVWVCLPSVARADLLDEDEDTKAEPTKPSPTPESPQPSADKGKSGTNKGAEAGKVAGPTKAGKEQKPSPDNNLAAPKSVKPPKNPSQKPGHREPVYFESKGLKGLREKGFIELVENVVVTQGDMRMEAEKATVYFDKATNEVVQIVAQGNVKLYKTDEETGEKIRAYGNRILFTNKERLVVMDGDARLWRGADLVRGKKISYEMDTGWIKADKVAGEVHPGDKK